MALSDDEKQSLLRAARASDAAQDRQTADGWRQYEQALHAAYDDLGLVVNHLVASTVAPTVVVVLDRAPPTLAPRGRFRARRTPAGTGTHQPVTRESAGWWLGAWASYNASTDWTNDCWLTVDGEVVHNGWRVSPADLVPSIAGGSGEAWRPVLDDVPRIVGAWINHVTDRHHDTLRALCLYELGAQHRNLPEYRHLPPFPCHPGASQPWYRR